MDYKKEYYFLFGKIADALDRMEKENYEKAKEILVNATQLCEEKVMKDQGDKWIGTCFKKEQQKK